MFFSRRSTQAEYFDLRGRSEAETITSFRDLDRLNLSFRFSHPFVRSLPAWLGPERCQQLDILDLGAGTGLLGRRLAAWARARGWSWRFTNLDLNGVALRFGEASRAVVGSVTALPFADNSFDLAIASQMTHHLSDGEIVAHLREAWRVTRDALLICDLHRSAWLYALLWCSMRPMGIDRTVREDALRSVKRGFRLREWRDWARQAGLAEIQVRLRDCTRIVLQARKGDRPSARHD
jgi:ubiquinone/menaquinone biosynthesis C-methylase UbiE